MLFLKRYKKTLTLMSLILVIGSGIFWYAKTAFGVTRTWDGGGVDGTCGGAGTANNWTCAANWTGDTVPTSSDTAVFDGTSTKNATINANLSGGSAPAGISINAGYSGTITQATGVTISVGASGFSQAAGTFTGGNSTFDINGTFSLSGGIFTSTTGILEVGRTNVVETIFTVSGGTFNHNNGTVSFAPNKTCGDCGNYVATVDIQGSSPNFYNVIVYYSNIANGTATVTAAAGDTIIVTNDFTQTDGYIDGVWEVQGNINIGGGSDGGTGTLTYTGTGAKTYTYSTGGWGSHLRVNTASGTLSANPGTTDLRTWLFTLTMGTFTAPSGTFTIGRSAPVTATTFTISGGIFNHNNGTIEFYSNKNCNDCGSYVSTVDILGSTPTFYNIVINATNLGNGTNAVTPAAGDTIIALNSFAHTNGVLEGTWEIYGDVIIGSGADGGGGTLTYTAAGGHTYAYSSGGIGPHLRVNNASATVSAASGTSTLRVDLFSLFAGIFTAPTGIFSIGRQSSSETFFTVSGGIFNHNNGTVSFIPKRACSFALLTIDVVSSLTLYNIDINAPPDCSISTTVTTASGDTLIAAGNFTQTDGILQGTWEIKGNTTIATTADGGTATLSFTGTGDQTYTDQGGNEPDGSITINKPVGTAVNLASNADWNAASQTLTITSGILNVGSYTLSTGGTLTVGANGVLHDYSTGDLILGGTVSNSGVIRLESSGTCGGTDAISITSSTGGVQRTWSGSGIYTLWDTSIQDQGGTAKVQVNSGTSVSGNGTNFVFSSACNLANNTGSLTTGLVGYWPMEENSGTSTADMSGNGNNGTLTNGPTWTTGQIGNATNFDGANDFIALQDSSVFDFGGAGSFCHWFYSTTFQNGIGMFSQDVSGAPSYKWLTYITGSSSLLAVYIRISGTAYSAVGPSKTVSYYDNAWHHICGIFDKTLSSNRLKIYIDGNLAGAADAVAGDVDAGSYPSLGMWYGNSYFTGRLDEVRIYNRALTATEVQQLYNNVRPAAAGIPSGKFQVGSGKLKFP